MAVEVGVEVLEEVLVGLWVGGRPGGVLAN